METNEMTAALRNTRKHPNTPPYVQLDADQAELIAARLESLEARLAGYLASDPPPSRVRVWIESCVGYWNDQTDAWVSVVTGFRLTLPADARWYSFADRNTVPASQVEGMA